jgi:hypothetical protein
MIELELNREVLDCLGWHRANDDEWSERAEAMMDALLASSPKPPRKPRHPTLEAAIKAAERAGLTVRGATLEGERIHLEFGPPESAPETTLTPLEAWRAKRARKA